MNRKRKIRLQRKQKRHEKTRKQTMHNVIEIQNNGPYLVQTNYWETDLPGRGIVYFSINASALRILLPDDRHLNDICTAKEVVISRGPCPSMGLSDALEVMFEDGSDSPFAFHTSLGQWDLILPKEDAGRQFKCLVYTKGPILKVELPVWYRIVPSLPHMKPWVVQNQDGENKKNFVHVDQEQISDSGASAVSHWDSFLDCFEDITCRYDDSKKSHQAKFSLGRILVTPAAGKTLRQANQDPLTFIMRHVTGDWGEIPLEDKKLNEESLVHEADTNWIAGRVLSAYRTTKGERLWVITEADRSITTVLLPEEY